MSFCVFVLAVMRFVVWNGALLGHLVITQKISVQGSCRLSKHKRTSNSWTNIFCFIIKWFKVLQFTLSHYFTNHMILSRYSDNIYWQLTSYIALDIFTSKKNQRKRKLKEMGWILISCSQDCKKRKKEELWGATIEIDRLSLIYLTLI